MSDFDEFHNFTNNATYYQNSSDFCDSDQSTTFYFRIAIYLMYAVIFVVATLGNGMVCYVVISSSRMRTVTNYFITNLAVGDLLITVFCVPFTSISYLKQYWSFGSFLCPVVNYFQAVAVFVSSYTLVAISIDRYMAIMWPLKPRMTKRLASLIILTVWIISMITVVPILVFSKLTQPNIDYEVCEKYICREDWSSLGPTYEDMYTKALALFQFIVPLSVFVFTYTSIAVVIWCHRIPGEAENCRDQRIAKSKRKVSELGLGENNEGKRRRLKARAKEYRFPRKTCLPTIIILFSYRKGITYT
ncbi:GPRNPY4 [Trypoxylus dichotomus]